MPAEPIPPVQPPACRWPTPLRPAPPMTTAPAYGRRPTEDRAAANRPARIDPSTITSPTNRSRTQISSGARGRIGYPLDQLPRSHSPPPARNGGLLQISRHGSAVGRAGLRGGVESCLRRQWSSDYGVTVRLPRLPRTLRFGAADVTFAGVLFVPLRFPAVLVVLASVLIRNPSPAPHRQRPPRHRADLLARIDIRRHDAAAVRPIVAEVEHVGELVSFLQD